MAGTKAKGGKKNRKLGRNANYCSQYLVQGKELINRKRKMRRHLRAGLKDGVCNDIQGLSHFKAIGGKEDAIFT